MNECLLFRVFKKLYVRVWVGSVHMSAVPTQPEELDPFGSKVTGSCEWPGVGIGTKHRSFARAIHCLYLELISPIP